MCTLIHHRYVCLSCTTVALYIFAVSPSRPVSKLYYRHIICVHCFTTAACDKAVVPSHYMCTLFHHRGLCLSCTTVTLYECLLFHHRGVCLSCTTVTLYVYPVSPSRRVSKLYHRHIICVPRFTIAASV